MLYVILKTFEFARKIFNIEYTNKLIKNLLVLTVIDTCVIVAPVLRKNKEIKRNNLFFVNTLHC